MLLMLRYMERKVCLKEGMQSWGMLSLHYIDSVQTATRMAVSFTRSLTI